MLNSTIPVNYQWWKLSEPRKRLRNERFPALDAIINIDTIDFTDSEKQSIKSLQFQEICKRSHRHPCAIDDGCGVHHQYTHARMVVWKLLKQVFDMFDHR